MKIKPAKNRVIITPIEAKETTSSGLIILPEGAREVPSFGTVVASSVEAFPEDSIILYSKYAGVKFNIDDDEYVALKEDDIHLTMED